MSYNETNDQQPNEQAATSRLYTRLVQVFKIARLCSVTLAYLEMATNFAAQMFSSFDSQLTEENCNIGNGFFKWVPPPNVDDMIRRMCGTGDHCNREIRNYAIAKTFSSSLTLLTALSIPSGMAEE